MERKPWKSISQVLSLLLSLLTNLNSKGCYIAIGAETCHKLDLGAYTDEVTVDMIKDVGDKCIVIGHSERRRYYNETNFTVNKKVHAALVARLIPIICVEECLEQRELGVTQKHILRSKK